MSCSTMFKRSVFILCTLVILLPGGRVRAEESVAGEILVIYESGESEEYLRQVQTLVEHLTYMGRSVSYKTVSQAQAELERYDCVLAYCLRGDRLQLARQLSAQSCRTFIVGSDFFQAFYNAGGVTGTVSSSGQEKGELEYEFTTGQVQNASVSIPNMLSLSGEDFYESGRIYAGGKEYPFCSGNETARFTPVVNFGEGMLQSALIEELTYWLWPFSNLPHTYGQYIVLDQIYPFTDPQELLEKVKLFVDHEMPFVLSVMPVYRNQTYPAMQQFCEVLKYAQANGGAVIMHAPIMQNADPGLVELQEFLTAATQSYLQMGVYPLGIEVPRDWTQNETCLAVMKRYSTVFIRNMETYVRTEDFFSWDYNILYYNYHQLIPETVSTGGGHVSDTSWFSSATYLDNAATASSRIEEVIQEFKSARTVQKSLYDMHHEVWADNLHLSYADHVMKLNEEIVSLAYTAQEKDAAYDYQRNTLRKISFDLQRESGALLLISGAAVAIFLGMMIWGRYSNRKHFLPDSQDQTSEKRR